MNTKTGKKPTKVEIIDYTTIDNNSGLQRELALATMEQALAQPVDGETQQKMLLAMVKMMAALNDEARRQAYHYH